MLIPQRMPLLEEGHLAPLLMLADLDIHLVRDKGIHLERSQQGIQLCLFLLREIDQKK
jgi:hypothetical protein